MSEYFFDPHTVNTVVMCVSRVTHSFEYFLSVVTEHHEQVDLPAGVAVHRVDLQREAELLAEMFCNRMSVLCFVCVCVCVCLTSLQPGWSLSS